ncbi:astakine isoform X2 [Parasteatoda tepidariorum]|nr:astakine isoform X2 [Parasteatoda tepidariorum]XP_042899968.1 astakine isoform X2 [Parasteatoda tepidariorum]
MGTPVHMYAFLAAMLVCCFSQVSSYTLATSECRSQADCGPGECCVLGMMRYSMAQCMPLGQVEDYCRDDNPPENRTLYYPNGEPVEVYEIYTHVCPCDESLQCTDNFCAMDESYENNYLY